MQTLYAFNGGYMPMAPIVEATCVDKTQPLHDGHICTSLSVRRLAKVLLDIYCSYLEPIPWKGSDKPEWNLGRIWAISQKPESTNNASFIWLQAQPLLTIMSSPYMTIPSLKYKISRILGPVQFPPKIPNFSRFSVTSNLWTHA